MSGVLLIFLITGLVYWPTLKFGHIIDDLAWAEAIGKGQFKYGNWRNKISNRLYGCGTFTLNTWWDHAFQVFLHATASSLIYLGFGSSPVSLCAGLLYAVNPANNQTAIWLNGRRYLVNVIIVLLMLCLGPWGMILYPLTAFYQVNAIFAPVMYGLDVWWVLLGLPVFWLIAGKSIRAKVASRLKIIHNDDQTKFRPRKLIPIVKVYGAYCLKMISPGRSMMIYPFLHYWGMTKDGNDDAYRLNWTFWGGVFALCVSIAGLVHYWPQGQLFWTFLFMMLSILQWCGFISVTQIFTDRYVSLSNAFMMFFVCDVLFEFLGALALVPIGMLAGNYFANLQTVFGMYPNVWAFYDYHIYHHPEGPKCREFKASRLIKVCNDPMGAWEVTKRGLELNPLDMKLNMCAAWCMDILGDKAAVIQYVKVARDNAYIGQGFIVDKFQKDLFGIDIKEEVEKINNKQSAFDRKQRDNILAIYNALYPQAVNAGL